MKKKVLLGLSVFGLIVSMATLLLQLSFLLQSTHPAQVTAKAYGEVAFCINSVPSFNITCNSTMSQNSTYYCLLNATDREGNNVTFSSNATFFNVTPNGTINFTPVDDDVGNHTVLFFATDSSGCALNQTNESFSFSVENINDPPYLVQNIPNIQFLANTTVTAFFLTDYFRDPDDDMMNFTGNIPTQFSMEILASSEVRISGTACDATDILIFTATDPYNASTDSNSVTVTITCPPPPASNTGGGADAGGGGGGGGALLCKPNWECEEWFACLPNGQQWRRCYDLSGCETEKYLKRQCEYEGPPPVCQENWLCTEWGQCRLNGTQERSCQDLAGCGTSVLRPPLEQKCTYIATCNDGVQNGDETGIDCGGSCAACSLLEQPAPIDGRIATWVIIMIVLSIIIVSGVAHYYRAQIAQLIATLGFMLRHRAYKDILLDAAQRKSYFERLRAFEQLLASPAGKQMKPDVVYNTLSVLARQYFVDALGVHPEAVPEEIAARCKELRLRPETTGMLAGMFAKLGIIEQEALEFDEYFVLATVEELRTAVCLTSDYTAEELNRQVEELKVSEEMSFFDEIFARSINAMRAIQFNQFESAKAEYMTMLSKYDALDEQEKEQIYPQLTWLFGTMKFQSEITGARVVKKT